LGRLLLLLLPCWALSACEVAPRFIEESSEVDAFLARNAYRSACVGLSAQKGSVREYTAGRLAESRHIKAANDCLCAAVYNAEEGTFDKDVIKGLAGSRRDDLSACLAGGLEDARITGTDRAVLVRGLGAIDAPAAYAQIAALVLSDDDPETRAMAAGAVRPSEAAIPTLLTALQEDDAAVVRAAAAEALTGRKQGDVVAAVTNAAADDLDGAVRGAALKAVAARKESTTDAMICAAMMDDADERVRVAAIEAWHGTKRKRALDCLDRRMKAPEDSGAVRVAVLEALKASPSKFAAQMLCDNVGPWVRLHIRDKIAYDIPGADIMRAQNDRDYERSLECVTRALRAGGYSCYGRNYLGHWARDVGGQAPTPHCPGMRRN